MKSFSVNLTRAEWLEVLFFVEKEISNLSTVLSDLREECDLFISDSSLECISDSYLRLLSVRKKINKKLDENY